MAKGLTYYTPKIPREEVAEIEDWESIYSDIFDPVNFTRAYISVYSPTKRALIPMEPYSYQIDFMNDNSPRKFLLKSRQIGFSWGDAVSTLHKCITQPHYEKIYVSVRQDQASELIRNCRLALYSIPKKLQPSLIKNQEKRIEFENGARVTSLPAKEASARGFHGDVTFDEFAFLPNDKAMLTAAMSVAVREGYSITVGSTPFGRRGEFHAIAEECKWPTYWTFGRRAKYRELYDSFAEEIDKGIYKNVHDPNFIEDFLKEQEKIRKEDIKTFNKMVKDTRRKNNSIWSFHAASWVLCPDLHYDQIVAATRDKIGEMQEYFLLFIDDVASLITLDQIKKAADPDLRLYNYDYCPPTRNRRIMGVDPASKINETAIAIVEEEGSRWICRYIWSERTSKDVYLPHIVEMFRLFNCSRVYIDATGMGGPITEDLTSSLGEAYVIPINLTSLNEREKIVYNMTSLFQSSPPGITIPYNQRLMMQLHSLEMARDKTTNKPKFTGKIKSEDGQDDMVWALALSLYERANMNSSFRYRFLNQGKYLQPKMKVMKYGRR